MSSGRPRRYPIGAEVTGDGGHFRVWAPRRRQIQVAVEGRAPVPLDREAHGYFSGFVPAVRAGDRYKLRLDDEGEFPDPASRFQPDGPHGPSQLVDPTAFRWTDGAWRGRRLDEAIVYELHLGTFTPEGTYVAAMGELDALAKLGITVLKLMPVADFPGRFGWGYDGVNLFAPTRLYGTPDELRALVDAAHARGLAVILDVVYNHLGPDGNYLGCFSHDYVTKKYPGEWGDPINFDGPGSAAVREFFVTNARHWIEEFHFDGLRLDATQSMFDDSEPNILTELARTVRAAGSERTTLLIAENEPQHARLVRPESRGGHALDAIWNDDFHHSARVAVTGCNEAYYTDYRGSPQELVSAAKHGFLFQGQRYLWQKKRRGSPALDLEPEHRVLYVQNHDQVANSRDGARIHARTSPGRLRAITALLLLSPGTPMLFMGQEMAASSPFLYFADHRGDLARAVRKGRHEFLAQFPSVATADATATLPAPEDPRAFERCKLDWSERETHREIYALHTDLLRLRREDEVFAHARRGTVDGAVLGEEAFVLRWSHESGDRLLLVNFGRRLELAQIAEPLLAPPADMRWALRWSSDATVYGGIGTPPVETADGSFHLPAHSAVVLAPEASPSASREPGIPTRETQPGSGTAG